jgi:release factor glutamine methyltransferase
LQGDLFAAVPKDRRYALIVANPPYITTGDMTTLAPEITGYEPKLALVAGDDGLAVLDRLCEETERWLEPSGTLLFEVGMGQAELVEAKLRARGAYAQVRSHRDLGGVLRVVEAQRA